MNDVDTEYIGKSCEWWDYRKHEEFYYNIVEEMIGNRWIERRTQRNQVEQPI